MSVRQPKKFETLEDAYQAFLDLQANLSVTDLNPSDIRNSAPAAGDVEKGRLAHAEVSGTPTIFIRSLDGTLFQIKAVPA